MGPASGSRSSGGGVEAHGWSIKAMEGRDGGARFEITGVDRIM